MSLVDRPRGPFVAWDKMGAREVAHAFLIGFKAARVFGPRWVFDVDDFSYDTASDVVIVTVPNVGETWSMPHAEVEETLAEIERRFGGPARTRAYGALLLMQGPR